MHIPKKGLRALGIAESCPGRTISRLAGVVMRKDLRIDGFTFSTVTVGGMDASTSIINMVKGLKRRDINVIMLSGCVIAWFNIINASQIFNETGIPVICITYEDSEGLFGDIHHHFPDDEGRISTYESLGDRFPVRLHTNQIIFIRSWGLPLEDAARLCDDFTLEGRIPEPLRVARLCARQSPPSPFHDGQK
jgi:endonuclease V-like protein UPF0215 family